MSDQSDPLLKVDDLFVEFRSRGRTVYAVNGVTFEVNAGEVLVLVGESGSGKSATVRAALGLLPKSGQVVGGTVGFEGRDLIGLSDEKLRGVRGKQIGMVFQDAMSYLNPVLKVGAQLAEAPRRHLGLSRTEAMDRAEGLLEMVGIGDARWCLDRYPHQLSGGMRQRVMIAIALGCDPSLLVADEPTTALDVTIQAQILLELRMLQQRLGMAVLMITHDLGIAAGIADRIAVMYGGRIVETGAAADIFSAPAHPYTRGLLASVPRLDTADPSLPVGIPGTPPVMTDPVNACTYYQRCSVRADPRCATDIPQLVPISPTHSVASFCRETGS